MSEAGGLRILLFDDAVANGWAPFALTRPCGEIPFGRWRARERLERATRLPAAGHVTRPWLARYVEPGAPPVVDPAAIDDGATRLFWSSRAILEDGESPGEDPCNLWVGDQLAGVLLGPGTATPHGGWFAEPASITALPDRRLAGEWVDAVWDLAARGPARLDADLNALAGEREDEAPSGVHRRGTDPVWLDPRANVEPGAMLDTRDGPILLGANVEVRSGTRLAGPLYAGDGCRILGGSISALSAGPMCVLRGEIEEVTAFGYVNKAHDGFIGHAVLGSWVNLGAMTTNSDLKNNYGTIRVGPSDASVDTGLMKLGCLVGDHVKTAIGTLLNTGTIVGAGSNLFGAGFPPKWIPPFSWGRDVGLEPYRRDAFLETAARVLPRRGVEPDERVLGWLGDVWDRANR